MNALPPPTSAPAGWYPDPYTGGRRYFDGREWVGPPVLPPPTLERRAPHPELPLVAATGALLILALSLTVGQVLAIALDDVGGPWVLYMALGLAISYGPSIAWLFHVRARWGDGRFEALGWRFRWSDLGWGPLVWFGTLLTEIAVALLIEVFDVPFTSNLDADELDAGWGYRAGLVVTAVVVAPIVEELIFRGVVLRGLLNRMQPVFAIGLQGVLFGLAHASPAFGAGNIGLAAGLAGAGVALGAAAFWLRRTGPTVLAHAILNAVALAIAFSGVFDDIPG